MATAINNNQSRIIECSNERKSKIQAAVERKRQEELQVEENLKRYQRKQQVENVLAVIGALLAIIFALFSIRIFYFKSKQASKAVLVASVNKVEKRKAKKQAEDLVDTAIKAAIDEAAREMVRAAKHPEIMVSLDDIQICPECKGKGCGQCNVRGWIIRLK